MVKQTAARRKRNDEMVYYGEAIRDLQDKMVRGALRN
jgi:hypothetical protein